MEEKIIITSDSTCDLSPELIVANDIRIFPLRVILGGETYRDGIDITPQEIFAYVEKTGVLPKTSAPNTEDYLKFFAPLVEEGNTVIHFNISSGASASHDFASAAAREIGKIFCGRFACSFYGAGTARHEGVRSARGRQERAIDL